MGFVCDGNPSFSNGMRPVRNNRMQLVIELDKKDRGLFVKKIQYMLGLVLVCGSLALVGCGGGGGDDSSSSNAVETAPAIALAPTAPVGQVDVDGSPDVSQPVVDTVLIQPVEPLTIDAVNGDPNAQATAATPEPTTIVLGALGAVFLVSRRYRRKA